MKRGAEAGKPRADDEHTAGAIRLREKAAQPAACSRNQPARRVHARERAGNSRFPRGAISAFIALTGIERRR
jgi:hypothetical protein